MTVVASAACVVTYLDKTYTLTAGGSVEVRAGAGRSTISATAGVLTVIYDLDSVLNDKWNNWGSRETTGIFARDDGLVGDVVFDSLSTECIAKFTGTGVGPSPATPWTITGRSQVALHKRVTNLFDASAVSGMGAAIIRDGSRFTITNLYANSVLYDWPKYLVPGKRYTARLKWSGPPQSFSTGGIRMQHSNRNDTVVILEGYNVPGTVTGSFTTPVNIEDFPRLILYGNNSGVVTIEEIQIEVASAATAYTDYVGRDYTATFDQPAYGLAGTPCVVDWSNGAVEDPTDMIVIDGAGTWTKIGPMWRRDISDLLETDDTIGGVSICNRFGQATVAQLTAGTADECCTVFVEGGAGPSGGVTYLGIQYDAMASAANLTSFLNTNPLTIVARLAQPRAVTGSIPLVPSFAGTNMIFTDGGGEVSFAGYLTAQALWDEVAQVNERIDVMLGGG